MGFFLTQKHTVGVRDGGAPSVRSVHGGDQQRGQGKQVVVVHRSPTSERLLGVVEHHLHVELVAGGAEHVREVPEEPPPRHERILLGTDV